MSQPTLKGKNTLLLFWKRCRPTSWAFNRSQLHSAEGEREKATRKQTHKRSGRTCSNGNQTILHHRYCLADGESSGCYLIHLMLCLCFLAPVVAAAAAADNAEPYRHTQHPISNSFLLTNGAVGLCYSAPIYIITVTSALPGRGRNEHRWKLSVLNVTKHKGLAKTSHDAWFHLISFILLGRRCSLM